MTDTDGMYERYTEMTGGSVELFYCGKRVKSKNHSYGPAVRPHFLIVLIREGRAILYRKNKPDLPFGSGDMLIMFPDEKVHYRTLSDWSIAWVGVKSEFLESCFYSIGVTRETPIYSPKNHAVLGDMLETLWQFRNDGSIQSTFREQSLLYDFFGHLFSAEAQRNEADPVAVAKKIIEYNYNNGISVSTLAEKVYMDKSYFSRLFKEQIGMSPKRYILHVQIDKATELLQTTDYSITEIAYSVGFGDPLYFSRIFTKHKGLSPLAYRKQCKFPSRSE